MVFMISIPLAAPAGGLLTAGLRANFEVACVGIAPNSTVGGVAAVGDLGGLLARHLRLGFVAGVLVYVHAEAAGMVAGGNGAAAVTTNPNDAKLGFFETAENAFEGAHGGRVHFGANSPGGFHNGFGFSAGAAGFSDLGFGDLSLADKKERKEKEGREPAFRSCAHRRFLQGFDGLLP